MGNDFPMACTLLCLNHMKGAKGKLIDGWQARGWFDWVFTCASFVVFLCLEAALIYAYFTFVNSHIR